jgi:plastocyanin
MLRRVILATAFLGAATLSANAADGPPVQIDIKAQAFQPAEITVPADVKVELHVVNGDDLPAEFESYDLGREIVVPAHGQVKVFIGPLKAGRYKFFNDFHQESEGYVVVK